LSTGIYVISRLSGACFGEKHQEYIVGIQKSIPSNVFRESFRYFRNSGGVTTEYGHLYATAADSKMLKKRKPEMYLEGS
jgi:hypothetical protein